MWFFKKFVDVYYFILFEWFEVFFVSSIFHRMVIILIYLLQKSSRHDLAGHNVDHFTILQVFSLI